LALARQSWSLIPAPSAEDSAQWRCLEGALGEQLGDTTGFQRIMSGRAIGARANAARVTATCDLLIAQSAERRGYFQAAAGSAADALRTFERIHFTVGVALAAQWYGYALFQRGTLSPARRLLERAILAAQATQFVSVEAWARTGLAELLLTAGDLGAARRHAAIAARSHEARSDLWGLAVTRRFEGRALEATMQLHDAQARYEQAVTAFRRAGLALNAIEPLRTVALLQMRRGLMDSAESTLNETARLARGTGSTGWEVEQPILLARLAMLRGRLTTADSLLGLARRSYPWREKGRVRVLDVQVALLEAQLALRRDQAAVADTAVTYVSAVVDEWRRTVSDSTLRAGLAQLHTTWGAMSNAYPDVVARLAAAGRAELAFRFLESVRARDIVERQLLAVGMLADTAAGAIHSRRVNRSYPVTTLVELRRRLSPDEAFVALCQGIDEVPGTAIVVTRDTTIVIVLPRRDVLAPQIERFTRVAAAGADPVDVSRELGNALMTPIARALPPHVVRLLVSPDGDLYRVPFDALRLDDGRYTIERFAISIVPSATAALTLRAAAAVPTETVVAIGDAAFASPRSGAGDGDDPTSPRNGIEIGDPFASIALSRLPHSAEEARRVAQYGIRSRVITRAGATEAAVRQIDWRNVAVAHFATHGLVDAESQRGSALALTPVAPRDDGFLTAAEISILPLNAPLVMLSACRTLGGLVLFGEGLRGLAAPFLEAGARAVVATHWSIGDRSTVPFVDRFYAALAGGARVDDALRLVKLAAIRDGARISDWGAFAVIGDGAMQPRLRRITNPPRPWLRDTRQPRRDTTVARS
jgi:CHAT domain-containing protein/tetratricopeptide (TPR) repeat protein